MEATLKSLLAIKDASGIPFVARIALYFILAGLACAVIMSIWKSVHWKIKKTSTDATTNMLIGIFLSFVSVTGLYYTSLGFTDSFVLNCFMTPIVYIIQKFLDMDMIQKVISVFIKKGLKKAGLDDKEISEVESQDK